MMIEYNGQNYEFDNWVGEAIARHFIARFPRDTCYVEEKLERFSEQDLHENLMDLYLIDEIGLDLMSKQKGISGHRFLQLCLVYRACLWGEEHSWLQRM